MSKPIREQPSRRKQSGGSLFDFRIGGTGSDDEALERNHAFQRAILAIPGGRVSTYGKVAEAAGYPRYHRAVARLLGAEGFVELPWHRVVGADGAIKTSGPAAKEQRARLQREGVRFDGGKIDLRVFLHKPDKLAGNAGE